MKNYAKQRRLRGKTESFESITRDFLRAKSATVKTGEKPRKRGEEEVEEEERSGPGPVRNVIRPRKLQFPRGPGITARRHKIYSTRVRARARLLAVARFLIVFRSPEFGLSIEEIAPTFLPASDATFIVYPN